jgi:hypothetical protein
MVFFAEIQIFVLRSSEKMEADGTKCFKYSILVKAHCLAHIQSVSMEAWDLGYNISGNEQINGFKVQHQDKERILQTPFVKVVTLTHFISITCHHKSITSAMAAQHSMPESYSCSTS